MPPKKSTTKRKVESSTSASASKRNKKTVESKENKADSGDDNLNNKSSNDEEIIETPKTRPKYDVDKFKQTSNGKDWNLKIVSWNVNGIRAWLEKNGMDYVKAEDPDIFCCQETKCDKSKIPPKAEIPGYHSYWLSGDTQGYSGVGLMTKIKPISVTFEIDEKHSDEGRVIIAEYEKFFLINSYIPNSGRGLVRLDYRLKWEEQFRKSLKEFDKKKPVIWCGDLNVAHNEIDLKNPKTNTKTAGFTKEERECFTQLLSDGYFDSFRYLYPNVTGAYTFWSYLRNSRASNVGWRLDYFVLSNKLKENLADNLIRSEIVGSDHCPIVLYLKV